MEFSYFYTIVFLVACLIFLNIMNRLFFMRFMNLLPSTSQKWTVKDVIQDEVFIKMVKSLNVTDREKAIRLRQRLKQVIFASFFVILLLIVVAIFSFIN